MEDIPKDVLSFMADKNLELPEILKLCASNKKIFNKVCDNVTFWINKLAKDYPDYKKFNWGSFPILSWHPREIYVFLYQLTLIKKLLGTYNQNVYNIFYIDELGLKNLTKIPAFNLPNLRMLDLNSNNLTRLPVLKLPNLEELWLRDNNLTEISQLNLPKLKLLRLSNNKLEKIPKLDIPSCIVLYLNNNMLTEIPPLDLPNLERLHLDNNKLTKLPTLNLPRLTELFLGNNELTEIPGLDFSNIKFLALDNNKLSEESKKEIRQKYKGILAI